MPSFYQYFPNAQNKGGTIGHVDYCPMYLQYSNTDCQDAKQNSGSDQGRGALYGEHSFCAISSLYDSHYVKVDEKKPNCFQMQCYGNKSIQVTIRRKSQATHEDISFNCYSDGEKVSIQNYYGEFVCPNYDDICTTVVGVELPQVPNKGNSGEVRYTLVTHYTCNFYLLTSHYFNSYISTHQKINPFYRFQQIVVMAREVVLEGRG